MNSKLGLLLLTTTTTIMMMMMMIIIIIIIFIIIMLGQRYPYSFENQLNWCEIRNLYDDYKRPEVTKDVQQADLAN